MDEKYVVFKKEDLFQMLGGYLPTGDTDCAPVAQEMIDKVEAACVPDAVVIRRQDVFAASALYSYANSIAVTVSLMEVSAKSMELQRVADYFAEQAGLAAEEGFKVPD